MFYIDNSTTKFANFVNGFLLLSVACPLRALWHAGPWFFLVLSIKPRLIYIHGFTSKTEATEK